jgi:hypothetical protein
VVAHRPVRRRCRWGRWAGGRVFTPTALSGPTRRGGQGGLRGGLLTGGGDGERVPRGEWRPVAGFERRRAIRGAPTVDFPPAQPWEHPRRCSGCPRPPFDGLVAAYAGFDHGGKICFSSMTVKGSRREIPAAPRIHELDYSPAPDLHLRWFAWDHTVDSEL